jgi:uncharacterized protein (DUF983 family)
MPTKRADVPRVLRRGLAARCPSCGLGRVFAAGFETARSCGFCGWRFERCPGHWIGGNEINLLATFPFGIFVYFVSALFLGLGPVSVVLATAATGAFSVAFHRPSRGLFFAIDYLIDATPDGSGPEPGPDRGFHGDGPDDAPSPPSPPPSAPAVTSESFIPPEAAPYPPGSPGVPVAQLDRAPVS